MKTRFLILFIPLLCIFLYFCLHKKTNDVSISFVSINNIHFEQKKLDLSIDPSQIPHQNEQPFSLKPKNNQTQKEKSFFSISNCTPFKTAPDSLEKKFKKQPSNTPQNTPSSLFEKFDCGVIQTIIPLPF